MLALGNLATDESQGRGMAESALRDASAWEKFKALVKAQGGDVTFVENPERLARASLVETVPAPRGGTLRWIDARMVGETAVQLGAGREKKGDPIDYAVGIEILHKVGDQIKEGEPLFVVHASDARRLADARRRLLKAHEWSQVPVEPLPLFYGVIQK
jgi:pyrimidine-nucleoside phosphorylase